MCVAGEEVESHLVEKVFWFRASLAVAHQLLLTLPVKTRILYKNGFHLRRHVHVQQHDEGEEPLGS